MLLMQQAFRWESHGIYKWNHSLPYSLSIFFCRQADLLDPAENEVLEVTHVIRKKSQGAEFISSSLVYTCLKDAIIEFLCFISVIN